MNDRIPVRRLADVAVEAARAGGTFLAAEFRNGEVEATYGTDDVKAAVDRDAERRVVRTIREAFPDHAYHGEESGRNGDHEYRWVVDPLDGTNNFASGLPSFATAVAALRDGEPVASAIHEPLPGTTYRAEVGGGATANGEPIAADSDLPLDRGTVSLVVGLSAIRDPERRAAAARIEDALSTRCKRVLQTWSPCVDWGLVARGSLEGIVCYHPDVYEQYAGELLAAEAGVESEARDGVYVGASAADVVDALWDAVEAA
ncbi:inositol monophosphatase family protein [Halegenticoccus tardaugens]|uniref:inositol monophosphatase family protein n=1 Tax=Halegenticoccus tardaugens TaxID=2071624 RepID=UPI00100BBDCE|nr:inositol monophosphatase [Halegenticoccus tardaugens]